MFLLVVYAHLLVGYTGSLGAKRLDVKSDSRVNSSSTTTSWGNLGISRGYKNENDNICLKVIVNFLRQCVYLSQWPRSKYVIPGSYDYH